MDNPFAQLVPGAAGDDDPLSSPAVVGTGGTDNPFAALVPSGTGTSGTGTSEPGLFGTAAEALRRGVAEGITETGNTLTQPFKYETPKAPANDAVTRLLAKPISQGWADPKWWTAQITYGAAKSAPSLTLAGLGAAAGSEVAPGAGTVVGGAAGFGLGGALQTLAPAYQRARQDGLDHDAAVDLAIKETGIAGAFGTVMGAIPGASVFGRTAEGALKKPISEALLQIFGTLPAVGTGQHVATLALEGKPITADELGTTYALNAGTGMALVGGHAAARALTPRRTTFPPSPMAGMLQQPNPFDTLAPRAQEGPQRPSGGDLASGPLSTGEALGAAVRVPQAAPQASGNPFASLIPSEGGEPPMLALSGKGDRLAYGGSGEAARKQQQRQPDKTALEVGADKLTNSVRTYEDELRAGGAGPEEIAAGVNKTFRFDVTPQQIASGNVWWRLDEQAARESGRAARGRFAPATLSPDAEAALRSDEFRALTNVEAARALKQTFGIDYSRETIVKLRHDLGVPASERVALPDAAEKALRSEEFSGLTHAQAAAALRERFGVERSPNSVRLMRERRGLTAPSGNIAAMTLPSDAEAFLRSPEAGALGNRALAKALAERYGVTASRETVRKIRNQAREDVRAKGEIPDFALTPDEIAEQKAELARQWGLAIEGKTGQPEPLGDIWAGVRNVEPTPRRGDRIDWESQAIRNLLEGRGRAPSSRGDFPWPPEALNMIRAAEGRKSFDELARALSEKFGRPVTYDMVAGKVARLRDMSRRKPPLLAAGGEGETRKGLMARMLEGRENAGRGIPETQRQNVAQHGSNAATGRRGEAAAARPGEGRADLGGTGRGVRRFSLNGRGRGVAVESANVNGLRQRRYYLYSEGSSLPVLERSPQTVLRLLKASSHWLAKAHLSEVAPGRWEVLGLNVRRNKQRRGLGSEFLDALGRDVGVKLGPSPSMTRALHRLWEKRDPAAIAAYKRIGDRFYSPETLAKLKRVNDEILRNSLSPQDRGRAERYARLLDEASGKVPTLPRLALSDDAGDVPARRLVGEALRQGRPVSVPRSVIGRIHEAIRTTTRGIPKGTRSGALTEIEPLRGEGSYPGADMLATFTTPDGERFQLELPASVLRGGRAFYDILTDSFGFIRYGSFGSAQQFIKTVAGEIYHESVHSLRRKGLLGGAAWDRLVSHADRLRLLDSDAGTYLKMVGDPAADKVVPGTLRTAYERAYQNTTDLAERMDQEAVAHLVELYSHGALLNEEIEPVRDLLEKIASGGFGRTEGRRGERGGPSYAIAGEGGAAEPYEVTTPGGEMQVRVAPEVVDLSTLRLAAGTLQPRDRSRAESQIGVRERAANLDPQRLLPERVSDSGAPIVTDDGTIISGNGRALSIAEAYNDPALRQSAEQYRATVLSHADAMGLGEDARAMRQPVLVARIAEPLSHDDLARFADLSNRSAIAQMSATERATRDARAAGAEIMGLYHGGEFTSAQNREFFRAFADAVVTANERGAFSRNGVLTKEGEDRLSAAVLAAAYGEPAVLTRMLESADDNIRGITGAMRDAAGAFIRLKDAISAGEASPRFDITPQIAEAARRISELRERGVKLEAFLAQQDAFSKLDPVVEDLLLAFYHPGFNRALSREKLATLLTAYAEEAQRHTENGLIPDETQTADIIRYAAKRAREGEAGLFDERPSAAGGAHAGTGGANEGYAPAEGGAAPRAPAGAQGPLASAIPLRAGGLVVTSDDLIRRFGHYDAAGALNYDNTTAEAQIRRLVKTALAKGRTVDLVVEGKVRRIVGLTGIGLKDDKGQSWGTTALVMNMPGETTEIRIGPKPGVQAGPTPQAPPPIPASRVRPPQAPPGSPPGGIGPPPVPPGGGISGPPPPPPGGHGGPPPLPFGNPATASPGLVRAVVDSWTRNVQPELVSERALQADARFAEYRAASAQRKDTIVAKGDADYELWSKIPQDRQLEFLHNVETGNVAGLSAWERSQAAGMRRRLDAAYALEKVYGSKANYVDEYLPHIWENADRARQFFETLAASSLGPTWFQKLRTYDLIKLGMDHGLVLKTTNPEELVAQRLFASADMVERMSLLHDLRDHYGLAYEAKQIPPRLASEGWQRINAPDRQQWMIAPDIAPLWQNAVIARGLWANEGLLGRGFRGWMAFKNAWVPVKLALSLFHPLHVFHINMAQDLARAFGQVLRGDVLGAAKSVGDIATGPVAAFTPFHAGIKAKAAWLKEASERTPTEAFVVQRMQEGGFSPQLSEQLRVAGRRALLETFSKIAEDARQGRIVRAGLRSGGVLPWQVMRRGIEILQRPIFERWIPALKAAAYLSDAEALLRRRPELLRDDVQRKVALRAIGKSVDNRFGEMFYSNLFWNRTMKDAGIGAFLSLGWNLGFVREFGGGALEPWGRVVRRVASGAPTVTRATIHEAQSKTANLIAYVGTAMALGGLMTYALSGEEPKELLDYIFPRVGGTNPDGTPRRVNTMFYTREVPMAIKHAQDEGSGLGGWVLGLRDMVYNKLLVQPFLELLNNRSYYGYDIRDAEAPLLDQGEQFLSYILKNQLEPLTVSGYRRAIETGGEPGKDGILAFLGFGPAPAYASRTETENFVGALYRRYVAPLSKPQEAQEIAQAKQAARTAYALAKQRGDREGMAQALRELGQAGGKLFKEPSAVYQFSRLPAQVQKSILERLDEDELKVYLPRANKKVRAEYYRERGPLRRGTSTPPAIPGNNPFLQLIPGAQ